jgi:glyoxylase-like metal-dependent hydrolase (beta-lactamase superfamily II)
VPIVGHAIAAERLRGERERHALREKQREDPRFAEVRLVPPTITFEGALRIDGGDLTLELIHTPGHTEDHIAVWVPELRLLLAGDAAEHPFPCVGAPETLPELRRSLERLARLEPAAVIPCHGGTTDPGLLDRNMAYFEALERLAGDALAAGRVPADWASRADLPDTLGLPYEEAVRRAGADPAVAPGFYRDFHLAAARAVMAGLAGGTRAG